MDPRRRVAVVAVAQTQHVPFDPARGTAEMAFEVAHAAVADSGLDREQISLTVSASSDMLEGRSFNFVRGLEALGTWPATNESHLEMDGAWAAYYAWVRLLAGSADAALVVAWGKSSEGSLHHVLNTQLDPFSLAPLGLDHVTTAALQADAWMARTGADVATMDEAVERSRAAALRNPLVASLRDAIREDEPVASPLWRRHCPPVTDGACALVLAADDVARSVCAKPAWIAGADHRTESGALGHRDLSRSASASAAAARARALAGWDGRGGVDVAEIGASFAHQDAMLREALALDGAAVNPSGGPLAADPIMATGLVRIGEAAMQIMGTAGERQVPDVRRALVHAATGHAMQQNAVFLLEGDA